MAKCNLSDFMAITRALADENRVRVLLALEKGELCICQIVEPEIQADCCRLDEIINIAPEEL